MSNFKTFSFNGRSLIELGAVMAERPTQTIAERDIEFESIPYLSGDAVKDMGRFSNKTRKIKIRAVPRLCKLSLEQWTRRLSEWLITNDYGEYRDDFNPCYFRKAIVTKIDDVRAVHRDVFETAITFNFEPFWYSDLGQQELTYDTVTELSMTIKITNPEAWDAPARYTIGGGGDYELIINGETMVIDNQWRTVIDKLEENVYSLQDRIPCNDRVTGLKISPLRAGENTIVINRSNLSGAGDYWWFKILPRWRRL